MSLILFSSQETFGLLSSPNTCASCIHFFDAEGIHVDQLGVATIRQLTTRDYLRNPIDVFSLTAGKLTGLPQIGPRQAQKIVNGIAQAKSTTLARLIYSCGIYSIDVHNSYKIANHFKGLESIKNADIPDLNRILYEVEAVNVHNFFRHPININLLEQLEKKIQIVSPT